MKSVHLYLLLPILALGVVLPPAGLQIPGIAEITIPQQGQTLTGSVTIRGTAAHPNFEEYDLSFSYSQDPTGTWFPIGEPVTNPVQDGRLAVWDTTRITDGPYRLRLRVKTGLNEPLVAVLEDLQVSNYTPTATSVSPLITTARASLTPTFETAPQSTPMSPAQQPASNGLNLGSAFATGMAGGALLLIGLSLYLRVRGDLRARLSGLKTRRFHRRLERDRNRDRK